MRLVRWLFVAIVILSCGAIIVPPGAIKLEKLRTLLADQPPPIVVHNQRVRWVADRTFETYSEGAEWTRTCPVVVVSRGVLLNDGTFVGISGEIMSGPLKGTQRDPRYEILNLTPQQRAPSVFRFTLPDWRRADGSFQIRPSDVSLYQATFTVPDDRMCADGYTGVTTVRLTFPDPPRN
jgi:hypothetical protein